MLEISYHLAPVDQLTHLMKAWCLFFAVSRGSHRPLSFLCKLTLPRLHTPSVRHTKNDVKPAFAYGLRAYCVLYHDQTCKSTPFLPCQFIVTPLNCNFWNYTVQSGPETSGSRSPRCTDRRARGAFARTRERGTTSRIRTAGQVSGILEKGKGKLAAGPRDIDHEPKGGASF